MSKNIYVAKGSEFVGFLNGKAVEAVTETINGVLIKSISLESGNKVSLPINEDGSIKWFDDTKLIRK